MAFVISSLSMSGSDYYKTPEFVIEAENREDASRILRQRGYFLHDNNFVTHRGDTKPAHFMNEVPIHKD